MIAGDGPTVRQLPDHAVEIDLAPAQDNQNIARVILRILQPKPDYRRLAILLLQRLKVESISIRDVGLRIVGYALFVRHVGNNTDLRRPVQ